MRMKAKPLPADRVTLDFKRYGLFEVPLIGRYTYTCAHPPLRQHIHRNVFEICVLRHGTQTYLIGDKRFKLTAGDMIITRPGDAHGTDTEPENRGRLYWVQFLSPSRERPFLGLPPAAARTLIGSFNHLPQHPFHNCDLLFETFERILSPPSRNLPKALVKASVQNLLLRLLLDIVSLTGRGVQPACSAGIRLALQHIEQHSAEKLTLARLASAAGISASYLKVHFPREVGMTPMERLMWQRIEKAKRLLRETPETVTALTFQLGFATSQHFATVFKRLTGLTPRAYRLMAENSELFAGRPVAGTGPDFHPVAIAAAPPRAGKRQARRRRLVHNLRQAITSASRFF